MTRSRSYIVSGKYDRGVVVAKKALEVAEQNVGPDHPSVAASLNNLAELYRTQGHYAQTEPLYKRAMGIWEKALGASYPIAYCFRPALPFRPQNGSGSDS